MVGTDGDASVKVGSTRAMVSVSSSRAVLSSNVYEIDDGDHVLGSAMSRALVVSAGATVTVDVVIFTAAMSVTSLSRNATAAVRELQFTTCVLLLVVTPVAIVTEHSSYALSTAVPAASVSVAEASPVLAAVAVKTVLPHPLSAGDPSPSAPPAAVPEPNSANAFEPLPASIAMVLAAPVLDDVMSTLPLLADATAPVRAPLMAVTVLATL
jgi:hypothetical protein